MTTVDAGNFSSLFRQAFNNSDGQSLVELLNPKRFVIKGGKLPSGSVPIHEFLVDFVNFHSSRLSSQGLESLCSGFRKFVEIAEEPFLLPVVRRLAAALREEASAMEQPMKWTKKVLEVLRESFPKFHRDPDKFEATVGIATEIIRACLRLDQPSLCVPVINTIAPTGRIDTDRLSVSVACTLFAYWSKVLILKKDIKGATERLEWAASHCGANRNYHKLLEYLVPCKITQGSMPSKELLVRAGLDEYLGICRAIRAGNVRLFVLEFEKHFESFVKAGTVLVVERLKLLCWRTFFKRVIEIADPDGTFKVDLHVLQEVWRQHTGQGEKSFFSLLSHLITIGALKGYMSLEHQKLVLSKADPYPKSDSWSW